MHSACQIDSQVCSELVSSYMQAQKSHFHKDKWPKMVVEYALLHCSDLCIHARILPRNRWEALLWNHLWKRELHFISRNSSCILSGRMSTSTQKGFLASFQFGRSSWVRSGKYLSNSCFKHCRWASISLFSFPSRSTLFFARAASKLENDA